MKEASSGVIDLGTDEALDVIGALLEFFYQRSYSSKASSAKDNQSSSLAFHVRVFAIADYYEVKPLKGQATTALEKLVNTTHGEAKFGHNLCSAIQIAYDTIPMEDQPMGDALVKSALTFMRETHALQLLLLECIAAVPQFGRDISESVVRNPWQFHLVREWRCNSNPYHSTWLERAYDDAPVYSICSRRAYNVG